MEVNRSILRSGVGHDNLNIIALVDVDDGTRRGAVDEGVLASEAIRGSVTVGQGELEGLCSGLYSREQRRHEEGGVEEAHCDRRRSLRERKRERETKRLGQRGSECLCAAAAAAAATPTEKMRPWSSSYTRSHIHAYTGTNSSVCIHMPIVALCPEPRVEILDGHPGKVWLGYQRRASGTIAHRKTSLWSAKDWQWPVRGREGVEEGVDSLELPVPEMALPWGGSASVPRPMLHIES